MVANDGFNPLSKCIVLIYRISHLFRKIMPVALIFHYINIILFGISINPKAKIGKGFSVSHPVGTVIGSCIIGDNVNIKNGVIIGNKENFSDAYPTIKNNVIIYGNAMIIGHITIGNNVHIGAGTFVNKDIPDNSVAYNKKELVVKREK